MWNVTFLYVVVTQSHTPHIIKRITSSRDNILIYPKEHPKGWYIILRAHPKGWYVSQEILRWYVSQELDRLCYLVDFADLLSMGILLPTSYDQVCRRAFPQWAGITETDMSLTNGLRYSTLFVFISRQIPTVLCHGSVVATYTCKPNQLRASSRRDTRWILQLKKGEMEYKDRLLALNLLPLVYDREIKDLTFFFKTLHGFYDLNILNFVVICQS